MFLRDFIRLVIIGVCIQSIDASFNWNKMNIESSRVLVGKVYERLDGVRSRIECQSHCLKSTGSRCKSYNYAKQLKICELNNVTKEEADTEDFQENNDYVYADDNDGDVCTNRKCCLDNSTNKNKQEFCFTQIALEKEESLSTSTSVVIRVRLIAGRADHINVTCSEGFSSAVNERVDFSENVTVTCDDVPPGSTLLVTVSVSYLDIPPATITMTIRSKTSPVTLKEMFTNSTAAAASWYLPEGEFAEEFMVTCSNGYLTLLDQGFSNGSAICYNLVPGSEVEITVNSMTDSVAGDSASLTMYLAPASVTFTNSTSSLISASVEWSVSGYVSTFVANCSIGSPDSVVIETADGSGSVECSDLSPGLGVNVTVVAIRNSKESLPESITISTDDPVNITVVEDILTNTSTAFARVTSNAPQDAEYIVLCSAGSPSKLEETANEITMMCNDLEAGSSVIMTVDVFYANQSVGSTEISISTVPDSVFLYQLADVSQFQAFFMESGQLFAVATFNLTSGTADQFQITCSEPAEGFPPMVTINDDPIAMCVINGPDVLVETIEITVKAEKDGKTGKSSSINVAVIHDDRESLSDDFTTVQDMATETDSASELTEIIINESAAAFDERSEMSTGNWSQPSAADGLITVEENTMDKSIATDATTVFRPEIGPTNESPTSGENLPFTELETKTSADQPTATGETSFVDALTNGTQTFTDVTQTIADGTQTTTGGTNSTTGGMKTTENGTESQTTTEG